MARYCFGLFLVLTLSWMAVGAVTTAPSPDTRVTLTTRALPTTPGYHVFKATAMLRGKPEKIACGICLPPAYFKKNADPMPIVVTLHNRQVNGNDGRDDLIFEGLAMLVAMENPDNRGTGDMPEHPLNLRRDAGFITLVPQCPMGFDWYSPEIPPMLESLVTQVAQAYHADADRMYLTGFSYGASSTLRVALQTPTCYAAIAPLDGRATPNPTADAKILHDVPTYLVVGADDSGFIPEVDQMNRALMADKNPNFTFRCVPHGNHWGYTSIYTDPDFWRWMFRQHRQGSPDRKIAWPDDVMATVAKNAHPGNPTTMPSSGGVLCLYWRDLPGNSLKELTDDPAFPNFPSEEVYYDQLEIPTNQPPMYGSTLRGWVHPPVTGDYTFYIASDNEGELRLSSDATADKAAKIAEVPAWCLPHDWKRNPQQQSKPVHLLAGQAYYLEARQKSGGGDNHLAVAWQLPDGKMEAPIPGSRLTAPALMQVPPPVISLSAPARLPQIPGTCRINVGVDYRGRKQDVSVWLVLPKDYNGQTPVPALVYLADAEHQELHSGIAAADGPAKLLATDSALLAWNPLLVIDPQCPDNQHWQSQSSHQITAAIIDWLTHNLAVDPQRLYCTGSLSGATALWQIAPMLATKPAAIVPFCTMQVKDPALPAKLDGTEVHIITGVNNGLATDCAHRMCDGLTSIHPAPDIVFEMKMGSEAADNYFHKQDFYAWLLQWHRPTGKAAEKP